MRKLSARNQIKGKIVGVEKGMTTAHVRIDIGAGQYSPRRLPMKRSTNSPSSGVTARGRWSRHRM
jgi:hypothetical protein